MGQNLGLGRAKQAKKYSLFAFKLAMCSSTVIMCLILLFKQQIPHIFTSDEQLITEITGVLPIYAAYNFFDYLQGSQLGSVKGMGL